MGIWQRHAEVADPAEAVNEEQAEYREACGWTRMTDTEVADMFAAAKAIEDAAIVGTATEEATRAVADLVESIDDLIANSTAELEQLTNDQLRDLAATHQIATTAHQTKAELIAAIQAGPPTTTQEA